MLDFLNTIKRNNDSFYDYQTNDRKSVRWRIGGFLVFSLILTVFLRPMESAAIGSILTVQSILMGFSFSVLFYLMSGIKNRDEDNVAIETGNKMKRLNKLSKELFFNVSYFNFLAICSVLLSLILLLPSVDWPGILAWCKALPYWGNPVAWDSVDTLKTVAKAALFLTTFGLYFVLIESLFTFFRTAGRVSFYFEKSLELEDR
jgi:hypothetical protein